MKKITKTFEQLAVEALQYLPEGQLKVEIKERVNSAYLDRSRMEEREQSRRLEDFNKRLRGWGVYTLRDLEDLITRVEDDLKRLYNSDSTDATRRMYLDDLEMYRDALAYCKRNNILK